MVSGWTGELPFLSICSCSHQNQSSKQPLSPLYPFLHLFPPYPLPTGAQHLPRFWITKSGRYKFLPAMWESKLFSAYWKAKKKKRIFFLSVSKQGYKWTIFTNVGMAVRQLHNWPLQDLQLATLPAHRLAIARFKYFKCIFGHAGNQT